eukprot:scaffold1062_cov130-Cylindrotheca_fusiformis.AAC.11
METVTQPPLTVHIQSAFFYSMKQFFAFNIYWTIILDAGLRVVTFSPPNAGISSYGCGSGGANESLDNASIERRAGTVVRLAAREYNPEYNKPSSRDYTPRKKAFHEVQVTQDGVIGDYNHYRTVALKSSKDRAVSILTRDVMESLRSTYEKYNSRDGDLEENILVEGVPLTFSKPGKSMSSRVLPFLMAGTLASL